MGKGEKWKKDQQAVKTKTDVAQSTFFPAFSLFPLFPLFLVSLGATSFGWRVTVHVSSSILFRTVGQVKLS